mmetsp:Transcript_19991/g.37609  ORF Transcript_19991/g.37609 Transcript_19991/m.37609 type:complete len:231 (+) Transcript_19991:1336-2028(+)
MGIAMKQSSLEHHCQIAIHGNTTKYAHVLFGALVQSFSNHPFRRKHLPRSKFIHDRRRKHHASKGSPDNPLGKRFSVDRLLDIIQLVHKASPPRINNTHKIRIQIKSPLDNGSNLANQMHIQRNLIHNIWTLHLHRHIPHTAPLSFTITIISHDSLVHLPETRRSNRLTREILKHLLDRTPQFALNNLPCLRRRKRRHLILQTLESSHIRRTQQIPTDTQTLTNLDKARS